MSAASSSIGPGALERDLRGRVAPRFGGGSLTLRLATGTSGRVM